MKRFLISMAAALAFLPGIMAGSLEDDILGDLNSLLGQDAAAPERKQINPADFSDLKNPDEKQVSIPEKKPGKAADPNYSQLSLGRNSLRTILSSLAELSGVNIFLDEAVPDKNVQLMVKDLKPMDAMRHIATSNGLIVKKIDQKNIFIYPLQKEQSYAGEEIVRTYSLKYTDSTQLAAIIKATGRDVKSFVNEKNNALVVFASADMMQKIDGIIKELDTRKPQIMLDMKLMEVESKALDELGLKFNPNSQMVSFKMEDINPADTNTDGDRWHLESASATFDALRTRSNAKILARPKIVLMARETAKIRIGDRIPVEILSSEVSEGINRQNNRIEWIDAGIKLEAELLSFNDTGEATLSIKTEVATPVDSLTTTKSNIPQLRTREADSKLRIRDGETVILGGLTNQQESDIRSSRPSILSRIPVLGKLFNQRESNVTKTEIVIFITPYFMQ
ncbi:MAG: secretin N-terminal domain-containing protein [Candidatus Wallbacteria bacterium]|nr:secretin N-terminal domain-containing protein [Candidatus Wallbacteria bacterium]